VTTVTKYKVLLETQQKIYSLKKKFNNDVRSLVTAKKNLANIHATKKSQLSTLEKVAAGFGPDENHSLQLSEKLVHEMQSPRIHSDLLSLLSYPTTGVENEVSEAFIRQIVDGIHSLKKKMRQDILMFDESVITLCEEKVDLDVQLKILEMHLVTIQKEMIILSQFEEEEEKRTEEVYSFLKSKHCIQTEIAKINSEIENLIFDIKIVETRIQEVSSIFLISIAESHHYEFLRNVFKRENPDDTYEMDETCSKDLYTKAMEDGAKRIRLESEVESMKNKINSLKITYGKLNERFVEVDADYSHHHQQLEQLQRQKLQRLNEIDVLAILNFDQIKNLTNDQHLNDFEDSLIVNAQTLSELVNRIEELTKDTVQQRERHELNKQHLQRLHVDINHMNQNVTKLHQLIKETMLSKFGASINLDVLEEALAKKLVSQMSFIPLEIQKNLETELFPVKKKLDNLVDQRASRLMENTKR